MSLLTLYLPKMGESVMEVVVLHWCIQEGESIMEGEPLLEVATDKVDAEIPAPYAGTIKKLLVAKGEVVPIGGPIALVECDPLVPSFDETICVSGTPVAAHPSDHLAGRSLAPLGKVKFTPLAAYIARAHAIPEDKLARLAGRDNRLNKSAILAYLSKCSTTDHNHLFGQAVTPLEGDEVVHMDRVRKLIADRMVQSKKIAPHVTSFIRADVTELVHWRHQYQTTFQAKYALKLSYNAIFMAVIARVLGLFPLLNAVVVDDRIIKRKHINIGFAVARSDGNLLVPVVRQVEQLGLVTLARQIDALIDQARSGTIAPDALSGGSYTVSNIGCFDNLMGTPIIVQPQVAILALGLIEKRPAVLQVEGKDTIAIRHELFLSHTYDHRIIDGAIGGGFLKSLAKELASFAKKIATYSFT